MADGIERLRKNSQSNGCFYLQRLRKRWQARDAKQPQRAYVPEE